MKDFEKYEKCFKELYKINKPCPELFEVEIAPGIYQATDKSGKVSAMYGPKFRQAIIDFNKKQKSENHHPRS